MSDLQAAYCGRNWKQQIVSISNVWRCGKLLRCVSTSGESRAYRAAVDPDGCVQNAHMFYIKLRDIDDGAR